MTSLDQELPRSPAAPQLARQLVGDWLGSDLSLEDLYTAKLLATELVTNAVLHGRGQIQLRGEIDQDRVLVEVIDEGRGFEREVRASAFADLHGRGLMIVDAEASRWGVHEGTTHVWFELERSGPRVGEAHKPTG